MKVISIVVPIYKVKIEYLKKCLDSIQKQTYKNIQVILILDGTTDKIYEFCDKYRENDSRFEIINRENKGVSYSRNEGISCSKGEWVTFVDADDWIEKEMCENCINTIEKIDQDKVQFIMFKNFQNYENKQERISESFNSDKYIDKQEKIQLFQSTYGTKYGGISSSETVWKNFYNKKFLVENNIFFPNNIAIGEDLLFNYMVWKKSKCGYFVNLPVYHYRVNEESVMNNSKKIIEKYEKLFPEFNNLVESMPYEYKKDYEGFYLKQIYRFARKCYFYKGFNIKSFKRKVSEDLYLNKIKKIKLSNYNLKKKIFAFLLKRRLYILSGCIVFFINLKGEK